MIPAEVFPIGGLVAMPMWLLMMILPKWKVTRILIDYKVVPLFIAVIYAIYVYISISSDGMMDFSSFDSVKELFTKDNAILAGWMHYICFDLLVGMWMVNKNQDIKIHPVLMAPCLFFTFMFGPIGFLLFLIIKSIKKSIKS